MLTTSPDMNTIGLVIGAAIVLVLILTLLLRGRRTPTDRVTGQEGDSVADGAAAAIEDTIGQLLGVDAHPDVPPPVALPEPVGDPDVLTTLKGLGPKAATRLGELGITRFDQLAALDATQQTAIDNQMGPFKGRLQKDRWIEQARYLAEGDRTGFETNFGKLG